MEGTRVVLAAALAAVALSTSPGAQAQDVGADPPGFGLVTLTPHQTIRLGVVCFEHSVGEVPPDACHGELMLHDATGNVLKRATYDLLPGRSAFLDLPFAGGNGNPRLGISPCILPAPGGRAVPSVQVFDQAAQRVVRFAHPAAARMSSFSNGSPGEGAPPSVPPDPPGFGLVTIGADQRIRLSVSCFEHPIGGFPPGPCRGEVMFHDANGEVLRSADYDVAPGESAFLAFAPPAGGNPFMTINPCVLPAPGGRAVPAVEVFDRATGEVALHIDPAVPSMSQFD